MAAASGKSTAGPSRISCTVPRPYHIARTAPHCPGPDLDPHASGHLNASRVQPVAPNTTAGSSWRCGFRGVVEEHCRRACGGQMLPDEMRRRVCWDDILLAMGMDEGQDDHMRRRKNIRSAQCEEMGSRSGRDRAEMLLDGQIALMSMV